MKAASFLCAAILRLHGEFDAIGRKHVSQCVEHSFLSHGTAGLRVVRAPCIIARGLGPGSSHATQRATRLAVCAVPGVVLVAVSVFSLSVAAKAIAEPAGASDAVCSELSERRDWLHAEIARLHAATALVEAQLVLLCTERSNLSDVSAPPLLALPSQSPGGTADQATGMQQTAQQTALRALVVLETML